MLVVLQVTREILEILDQQVLRGLLVQLDQQGPKELVVQQVPLGV